MRDVLTAILIVAALGMLATGAGYAIGLRDGLAAHQLPPDDGLSWSCWKFKRTGGPGTICCRPRGDGQFCRED